MPSTALAKARGTTGVKDLAAGVHRNELWESARVLNDGDLVVADQHFDAATTQSWFSDLTEWNVFDDAFWTVAVQTAQLVGQKFGKRAQAAFIALVMWVVGNLIYDYAKWEANKEFGESLHPAFQTNPQHNEIVKDAVRCVTSVYPEKDFSDWRIVSTKKDRLHIREEDTIRSTIIGHLNHADWVKLIEKSENNDWSLIEYQNPFTKELSYGWVFSRHLKKINPPTRKKINKCE